MKSTIRHHVVLVTAPDLETSRVITKAALGRKLVACANLIPGIESHYWWRGKLESNAEVLIVLKTTKSKLTALERLVQQEHPYDTPEFVVLPVQAGSKGYLDWIDGSLK